MKVLLASVHGQFIRHVTLHMYVAGNQHYLPCIAKFYATVLNVFLKEILSNNTKCQKQMLKFI